MCTDNKTTNGISQAIHSDAETFIPAGVQVGTNGFITGPFLKGNRMTSKRAHEKQDYDSQLHQQSQERHKDNLPHSDDFVK